MDHSVLRRIPIAWYGVASDVKLLGDFDSWTRGFSLSPAVIQDQTFTKFSTVITLLPVRSFMLVSKHTDLFHTLMPEARQLTNPMT